MLYRAMLASSCNSLVTVGSLVFLVFTSAKLFSFPPYRRFILCAKVLDVFIILDESGPVTLENYDLTTAFVKNFIKDLDAAVSLPCCLVLF